MTAAEKAAEKAKQEAAQGGAPVQNDGQAGLDLQSKTDAPATLLESETPEWVQTILDSNAAVIESNQTLIDALTDLKALANTSQCHADRPVDIGVKSPSFDEDAEYVVAEGKSFADKHDITKKYSAGEDVTHLGAERLQSLLNQGLIEEA